MKKYLGAVGLVLLFGVFVMLNISFDNETNVKKISLNNNEISPRQMDATVFANGTEYDLSNYIDDEESYVMINDEKVDGTTVPSVNYGDSVDIHIAWSLPNSGLVYTTNDTFVYQFPSNLTFANIELGPIRNGSDIVGYYSIVDNKVTIRYTDENFLNLSNIVGTLNATGTVTNDTTGGTEGGRVDLNIPGVGTFPIYVEPEGSLGLNKTINRKIDTDTYEYKLEVTSQQTNTNVIVGDNLGEYLTLNKNSIKIEHNGRDITKDVEMRYDYQIDDSTVADFIFLIPEMEDDDVITVTYQADVAEAGFIWDYTSSEDQYNRLMNLTNVAGAWSNENPEGVFDSTIIDTGKGAVSKTGSYNANSDVISWTIYVMPGEKGVTLSDYFENQEFVQGSLRVYETDINGSALRPSSLEVTFDQLDHGYTFEPDPTGEKIYVIYYESKPTNDGKLDGEVYNEATIEVGEESVYDGVVVEIGTPLISKYVDSADEQDGIISWNTTITASNTDLKNTVFKDVLGTGLTLVEESVKVNGQSVFNSDIFKVVEGGFEIHFGDFNPGDVFDITYDTTFDNSESGTFVNTAIITADGVRAEDDAEYEYVKKDNYITKYVNYNQGGDAYKTGIVTWQIDIDELPEGTEEAHIDDIIPEGMEYVEGSAKLVLNYNPWDTITITPTIDDNILTFDLTDHMDLIRGDNGVSIFYQSRLTDIYSEAKEYVNRAYITIDGNEYPEVTASVTGEVTNLIDKTAVYNTLTAPEVEYTIKVNEGAADLHDGSEIVLEDEMGSALTFIMGSLKVNGETWTDYSWDPDSRLLEITVPDSTALTITYNARVNLSVGEDLTSENAYNMVNIKGLQESSTEDNYEIIGEVLESSATSSGEAKTIYIYKYKDGIMTTPLEDAEFELYELGFTGSGNDFELTGEKKLVDTLVTGANGYASYNGLSHDTVYMLKESKTADGYILDDTEYYFVYPGNDNIDYPDYISEKTDAWTFYINNEYGSLDINVDKVWEDSNYNGRPSYVNVYLKRNGSYVYENGERVFVTLNSNNNWKASFNNLEKYDDNDTLYEYTVEEDVPVNYEANYVTADGLNEKNITITNKLTKGSLSVSKTVSGTDGEHDRNFTFEVTLTDVNGNNLTDSYNYTGSKTGTIKSGGTVSLKHGETITIEGLPEGTKYKVTEKEANTDRYVTTSNNSEGTINFGNNSVSFTNTRNEEPKGSLSVSKTVSGTDGEHNRNFTFEVTLTDANGNNLTGSYNYTGSKTGTIKSGGTITLKDGETITIGGLPVGTKYEVTEKEANTDRYVTTSTNDKGTISENTASVSFVNARNEEPKGSLSISKTVSGTDGEYDRNFTFEIVLTDDENNVLTDTYNYTGDKEGTITYGEIITLKDGETITIEGLPVGTKYEVTEKEANSDRYVTTSTNDKGTISENTASVSFVNTRDKIPTGSLSISKTVTGNDGELDREFTFEVTLTDANGNNLTDTYNYTGSKTGTIKSGRTVSLKHGETITIEGLPVGTKYEVTEKEANSDRYVTVSSGSAGEIINGNSVSRFENHRDEIPVLKGFLTINKTVSGNAGERDRLFNFKITFTDSEGNIVLDTFSYTGSKVGMVKSGDVVSLKHEESITIVGLPVGTRYQVVEIEANIDGYTTEATGDTGVIELNGNTVSFVNHKDEVKKPKESKKVYIPQTGGDDNLMFYGLEALASGVLGVYLIKKKCLKKLV